MIAQASHTYTKAYEQCLEWDGLLHPLLALYSSWSPWLLQTIWDNSSPNTDQPCRLITTLLHFYDYEQPNVHLPTITERDIGAIVRDMAKGKIRWASHWVFQRLWPTIGVDFYKMLLSSMEEGNLHDGVTNGFISFIPKEGDAKDLNHWRPITLLPLIYKIFAKTLQMRLQSILRDVISPEQTIYLPLMFILDNIMLTQETLHWVCTLRQPTCF